MAKNYITKRHCVKSSVTAVMRENAESLYFGYVELFSLRSGTFFMRKELKFRIKPSITFDNSAY